ncbi:hypothetical protein NUACC21_63370 [Scytonema sp. NUACC21]
MITGILFVDPSVSHYKILLKHLVAGIEAIVLDPERDGVAQITQVLSHHHEVKSVHIVSHGSSGTLYLGNSELSLRTLELYAEQLKNWFSPSPEVPFSPSPSLFLYGCHVAAGDAGTEFIAKLHQLTGANIAASTNLTGHALLGGDWTLEAKIGNISTQGLAFSTEVAAVYPSVLNAPTLNNEREITLNVVEDAVAPVGTVGTPILSLVSFDNNVTDLDRDALTGIAVISTTPTNGNWFYSINNGSNWLPLGSVSNNAALLLAADAITRIYFQPSANFNGSITDALTFRAWDQTSGTNGGIADASNNGGTSAFSVETETATVTVTAVNDAPILSSTNISLPLINDPLVLEDAVAPIGQVGTLISSLVSLQSNVTDPDNNLTGSDNQVVTGIAITNANTTNGTWFYSTNDGNDWAPLESVSNANVRLLAADGSTRIYFQPNANFNASINNALTFRAWDQTFGTNGGTANATITGGSTAFSTATGTLSITITPVNDPPTLRNADITLPAINENIGAPIGAVGIAVSSLARLGDNVIDPDNNAVTGIAITSADNTNGIWFYTTNNGNSWIPLGLRSDTNARLLAANASTRIYFQPNANFNGSINNALIFRAWDQTFGTNGSTADTTPNENVTAFSTEINTATITVNAVNDAPILSDTNITLNIVEDANTPTGPVGTLVSSLVSLGVNVTDLDQNPLTGIAITSVDTINGSWFYSTDDGSTWSPLGLVSNTNARLLAADGSTRIYFQPNANFNGSINNALTFRAWDQTSGTNGSTTDTTINGGASAFSSAVDAIAITIDGANDAPTLTDTNVTLTPIARDAGVPIGAVGTLVTSLVSLGVNVTDPDSTVTGIAITSTDNTNGIWFYSTDAGSNWSPLGFVSDTNARLLAADPNTRIYFQPNANFNGIINNALTFRAWDQSSGINGGNGDTTLNGGATAFSSTTDTAAITVGTVNNAPTLRDTNVTLTAIRRGALTPVGAVGTLVSSLVSLGNSVIDPDPNALTGIAITNVDASNGSWFYSTDNGNNWVPLGVVSNVAARLLSANASTRIYFQPNANFSGAIANALTFRAWDQTTGTNGSTADTTINGGITAFSSATDVAAISVNDDNTGGTNTGSTNTGGTNTGGNNSPILRRVSDNVFQLEGGSNTNRPKLETTLVGRSSSLVNELGVFVVDDERGTINGIAPGAENYAQVALSRANVIFSVISNPPNGFNTDLNRLLEFNSGQRLRFFLVNNSSIDSVQAGSTSINNVIFSDPSTQRVTDLGNGEFTLAWEDASSSSTSDFQDLQVRVRASSQPLPIGAGLQGNPFGELIDLRNVSTQVRAEFVLNREAVFNNFVSFYQVADVNGGIDINGDGTVDLRPGDANYAQTAVQRRVAEIDLRVSNQSTVTSFGTFSPGSLFAPFIIVNGTPEAITDGNPNNDPATYFSFLGANPDRVDRIRLLGNNTFGFEDLPNGGDNDYNDMIVRVNLSIV